MNAYMAWYFPAYLPLAILLVKWSTLWTAGVLDLGPLVVDLGLAVVTFDIWAITTKLRKHPIRIDGRIPEDEWALVVSLLILHISIYTFNAGAWLIPSSPWTKLVASTAVLLGAFGPVWVLGSPAERVGGLTIQARESR